MALPEITTSPPLTASTWAHRCRLALALAWLILAVGVIGIGERRGSFTALEQTLDAGRISSVSVEGDGLVAGADGPVTQTVHWRAQGQHRITEVVVRARAEDDQDDADAQYTDVETPWWSPSGATGPPTTIIGTDVGAYLQDRHPQLLVTRPSPPAHLGSRYLGWQMPTWLFLPGLLVYLGTLGLLISGPQPWRATRWAWFWLFLNPIGTPLFLLLSGPTPLVPAPRRIERRLTGGWAFLLSLILPG